jgi:hypothetical protein
MDWFLKCFYGYHNLWDEFLLWGVLDYIDTTYPSVDELTVEVADVGWMHNRWNSTLPFLGVTKLAQWFVNQSKIIRFVDPSKDIRDNFRYDIYFFWWGEVLTESRWFYGGRNYLLRYVFAINFKPFVLLWGIEAPTHVRQKILYRYLLPKADKIICREQHSYRTAHHYNKKTLCYMDFVVPVVEKYKSYISWRDTQYLTSHDPYLLHQIFDTVGNHYILINMIATMSVDDSYIKIAKFVARYPDHKIVYISCGLEDKYYADRLVWAYPGMIVYNREEHTLIQTLSLFEHAKAGIGCRLHFLLLLQEFERDRYALIYAQKVRNLITSTPNILG